MTRLDKNEKISVNHKSHCAEALGLMSPPSSIFDLKRRTSKDLLLKGSPSTKTAALSRPTVKYSRWQSCESPHRRPTRTAKLLPAVRPPAL